MKLTGITFTGADGSVKPSELLKLSERYPFIEWGILFSKTRQGLMPRYPDYDWIHEVGHLPIRRSAHLCGTFAAEVTNGELGILKSYGEKYRRVQLNGFGSLSLITDMTFTDQRDKRYTDVEPGLEFLKVSNQFPETEFILQAQNMSVCGLLVRVISDLKLPRASILYDMSGGTGVFSAGPYPYSNQVKIGQAGGVDLSNILHIIEWMPVDLGQEYWIDMESKLRDDRDCFSIEACKRIAGAVEKFVTVKIG